MAKLGVNGCGHSYSQQSDFMLVPRVGVVKGDQHEVIFTVNMSVLLLGVKNTLKMGLVKTGTWR